jgi:hypothetical protein
MVKRGAAEDRATVQGASERATMHESSNLAWLCSGDRAVQWTKEAVDMNSFVGLAGSLRCLVFINSSFMFFVFGI